MAPNPDETEEAHQTLNVFVESPRFGIQDGGDGEQAALQLLGVTRLLLGVPEGVVDGAVKEVKLQLSWSRILRQPVLAALVLIATIVPGEVVKTVLVPANHAT